MNDKFIILDVFEITSIVPINFTERALRHLYVDKLNLKDKDWILQPGGILDYENDRDNSISSIKD